MRLNIFFLILIAISWSTTADSQTSVMTYNIRYDNPNDGENWWGNRKDDVLDLVEFYEPAFLGIQEGMNNQVDFLDQGLNDYAYIGFGRDGKGSESEAVPVFYDSTRFSLIKTNTFWLSPTPDVISIGWDAALNRIATYGAFRNKHTGNVLHLFNCHFDHMGTEARKESAALILKKIEEFGLAKSKVIVMGDFNCEPIDEPYKVFTAKLDDAKMISEKGLYGPEGTWTGFEIDKEIKRRIDYIFCKGILVKSYRHIDDKRKNNLHVSDHLPVMIEIE